MATLNEVKRTALLTLTGLTSGTVPELEKAWLVIETGLPDTSSMGELNRAFLEQEGYFTGTNGERWYALLADLGWTGRLLLESGDLIVLEDGSGFLEMEEGRYTLRERLYQFWAAGGIINDFYMLLEAGDFVLLENGDQLILE